MSPTRKASASPVPQLEASVFPLPLGVNPPPTKNISALQAEWLEAFEHDFWPAYPRKVDKYDARKAWIKVRPWSQQMLDQLCAGLDRWVAYWQNHQIDKQFIPHAATWINKHRWEDEPE